MHTGSQFKLFAVTRRLPEHLSIGDLIARADALDPLVWVRGEQGCVGVGELARLPFAGPTRFTDAAGAWQQIADAAVVDDEVRRPGSGLIAFGTFAFDDESAAESVLIIPRILIARDPDASWVTEISLHPIAGAPELPAAISQRSWNGADLPIALPDDAYLDGVTRATQMMRAGTAEKIVIARRVAGEIVATDDVRVPLARLAERYVDCWTYAVDGLLGASPETLIRRTGDTISARVLAGTRGRGASAATDAAARAELLGDPKEQHEHALAVQSVITALSPHVHDLDCAAQPFALELPNVWHLATDVRATPAAGGSSLRLVDALHPTAAVAGTPTRTAVAAIAQLEPFDRGRYAGAVGWIDGAGDGEWVIALRCAQLSDDGAMRQVTAYAGGGILADSVPSHEFGETVSKLRPIAEAFAR